MMFGQDRQQMRRFFIEAWHKYRTAKPLEPLERIIAEIIRVHPEYHALLEDPELALESDYLPESGQSNPFLHMAMHIAIQEQVSTNRPAGMREVYQSLLAKFNDPHEAEHNILECLGEMLWQAQRDNREPDETAYLDCLHRLAGSS